MRAFSSSADRHTVLIASPAQLNAPGQALARLDGVLALTDATGCGLGVVSDSASSR